MNGGMRPSFVTAHAMKTRSRCLSTLMAMGFCVASFAQPYWVRHVGSLGNDHISDVKVDESGDLFITGEFSGDADFTDSVFTAVGGLDCFVARLTPAGEIIWWKQGGGYGIDRGIKLAFGPGNTLAVVGEFMGTANFQGTSITSSNQTPDMFCAVLDRSTGAQQWIRQGGGSEGADRPYGVTVSPSGQVTMVGEFQGNATWSGSSLTSLPDQDEAEPTMDVVVVSYSANGTLLWLQQGASDRSDRAIDAVSDPQGNIYVTGQFSDTITFDVEHVNAMYNATFLMKLDAAGNEVWFRRCGGAIYDHVRDLHFTPDNQLLMTGDLQGTMIFLDDVPDFISGEQPYNYYLLRVGTDGQLIAHGQIGSQNGLSARGVDLRDDTVAVVGQFNCQFTALSSHYGGDGLFMAAGSEDLFVNKHRYSDLGFIEARHYGGPGSKLAGQVAILPGGDVVTCGSFTRSISFATTSGNPIDVDDFEDFAFPLQPAPPDDCAMTDTTSFVSQDARGLKDGLLARVYVRDSVLYDWWTQENGACDHPATWTMCVAHQSGYNVCPDTLEYCHHADILAYLPFIPSIGEQNSVGPLVEVVWSNGDSTIGSHITETGQYSVQVNTANGCWSWSDDVYVIVNYMPPQPLISDGLGVNVASNSPQTVHICDPDSVLLWCTNVDPNTTYYWTILTDSPPPDTSFTTSVYADTSGIWKFFMDTDAGCRQATAITVVDHPTPDLDCLSLEGWIEVDSNASDSVQLCPGDTLQFEVILNWFCDGVPTPFPNELILQVNVNGGPWGTVSDPGGWPGNVDVGVSGWYLIHIQLLVTNGVCGGDSLQFDIERLLWVDAWPVPIVGLSLSGDSTMCVGDSTLLSMTCPNCSEFEWSGGNVGEATTTTVWATDEDIYSVEATTIDEHGCEFDTTATLAVNFPDGPLLLIDPPDGIICPFDSALVYTLTPGSDLVWYGPFGPDPNNSQQLWSGVPGEYYLTMTDTLGCSLVSDVALLTGYSTPYLSALPDNVLCLNEPEALIQIVTTAPSSIVWSPPFSGSDLQQTVTEPGTYSVTSTACGITTELSITVVASEVAAQIEEIGPLDLCAGESLVLHGVPGQAVYIWQPGNVFADSLVVSAPGDYYLQVVAANGCADTSDVIQVIGYSIAEPMVVEGDTICPGQDAILTAGGSGTITWYSDASALDPVFNGSPITITGLASDTSFFVMQAEGPCTSDLLTVTVVVAPPVEATIDAPEVVCGDGEAVISLVAAPGVVAHWTTPAGTFTGSQIIIPGFSAGDSGVYTAVPFFSSCTGDAVSVVIGFAQPMDFSLGADTTFCMGGYYTLSVPGAFSDPVWSTGLHDFSLQVNTDGTYSVHALDTSGCPITDEVTLTAIDCSPVIPNVITPNGDGNNDVFVVLGSEGFTLAVRIYNRWGQEVWSYVGRDIRWNGHHANGDAVSDGVYYYELLRTGVSNSTAYTGYIQVLGGK